MTSNHTYGAYRIGSSRKLTEAQLQHLVALLNRPPEKTEGPLGGRRSVSVHQIDGIGPIVIKFYTRGGLLHRAVKRTYLKWGKTRSQKEFEFMQKVRELGINAPEPIAYAYRGRRFYQAWLVTRKIHQPLSLARASVQNEKKTNAAMTSVIEQIALMINNNLLHVDLHPGNVVIGPSGKVYLLDFDKGRNHHGSREKLRKRYLKRWQRAVSKHGLPKMLTTMLQAGLN